MNRQPKGFTIIEILVASAVLILLTAAAVLQKNDIDASQRDQTRKTAINSFYYGLTEAYYKKHSSYPTAINAKILPYVNPDLFTDPEKDPIDTAESDYRYLPLDCIAKTCQRFELTANLEKEADYTRKSPASSKP